MQHESPENRLGRPRRVLFVITDLDVGGAEKCCVQLATGLDRSRWSPAVCSLSTPGALAERLIMSGVPVHSLDARRGWHGPAAVARLARLIARTQPDVVHTILFHANVIGRLAARLAGVTNVVSSIRVAERRFRRHLVAETLTCRLSRRIICVSEAVARFTQRRSHVPTSRIEVVPNGVETDAAPTGRVTRETLGLPRDSVAAIFVGRLDPQKGVDVLLRAVASAKERVPALELLIVGAGPDRDSLVALARQLDIEARTHWLGFRADVPALLHAADLFVLPSRWEGMPNVVLEAMAAGLPVIATATEGTSEIVRHDETGALVPIDADDALAREIVRFATDQELRAASGRRGQHNVRQEFSVDKMIRRHEHIYESVLARHN